MARSEEQKVSDPWWECSDCSWQGGELSLYEDVDYQFLCPVCLSSMVAEVDE